MIEQPDPLYTAAQQRTLIQNQAFQAAINGEPLVNALNLLAQLVKLELGSEVRTAFYLAYPDGKRLHAIEGAGDMDPAYTVPLNGFPVSDDSFCSGYAMATGRPVHTPDVFQNPLWKNYRHLAAAHGFRATSSYPILTRQGKAIGSLALYFPHVHQATAQEESLAKAITQAATIILSPDTQTLEHTHAEEALHRQQESTHIALEAADMSTWEWNLLTDEVYWNEQHFRLLGMEPQLGTIHSQAFTSRLHPDDRSWVTAELKRVIDEQDLFDVEFRMVRDDGLVRWMSGYGRVTKLDAGVPLQISGVMLDVTDRKEADEALKQSQERLQRVLSIQTVGVIYFDLKGHIHAANEAFCRMSGYAENDFVEGRVRWDQLTPPEFMDVTRNAQGEYRTRGENTPYEKQYIHPDGSRWWGLFAGKQLGEDDYVEFVLDISESKQTQLALEQADRRKDEFLAMLAHELRNPMATLRSGLAILDLTINDESTRSTVTMMNRQTDHLVRMVDDLLDVSRISRGKIELKKGRVDLIELVQQVQLSLASEFKQQGKVLHMNLPGTRIELDGDATRLTQVVANLLTNGLRYTGDGGQVWVSLTHQRQEAILQVRDNGIGLAQDQLSAIFELFVQVDNSTARSKGGLGLGLTLVKRLVELHGGRVVADSLGLGQGSTFTVHLPTLTPAAAPGVNPTSPATDSAAAQRLLVIDDNADAALMMAMLLKLKGYEAHTRTSGPMGIEAAEQLHPSAILLDIGMPGMDGYATCGLIREQVWGQDLVVIALTGYGQEEDRQRTKEAGFNGHLVKPVDLNALTTLLTALLDKSRKRSE